MANLSNQIHPNIADNPFVAAARRWLRHNWAKWLNNGFNWDDIKEQMIFEHSISYEVASQLIEEMKIEVK